MMNDTDVIVIGAGGGGAVVAKELGEKGIKVILLDAGPWYGNQKWPKPNSDRGEISSSNYEDLSIDLLKEEFTDLEDDMNNFVYGKFRWGPANRDLSPWPREIVSGGLIWQSAGIGGSTLVYLTNSPRAYPETVDHIWPISYEELIPYYEKVEETLPVWPAPTTAKEDLFYYGARKAGWEPLESPDITSPGFRAQPNAILRPNPLLNDPNFDLQNNKSVGCTLRGMCVNGCHIGPTVDGVAKRSTLSSYVPRALQSGNVEVRPNAFVIKVLTEENEQGVPHAVGVVYRDTWTKEVVELRANVVVMAGGSIETPRLWLNSELPENEWVGKGLVNHWFDSLTGIFEENELRKILGASEVPPFVGQNAGARFDYPGLGVIEVYGMSPGLYSGLSYGSSVKGYSFLNPSTPEAPWDVEGIVTGEQLKEFMKDYTRSLSVMIFTDDEVVQSNSITLDPVIKDENGYIPVIQYKPNENTLKKREELAVIAANILREAGAKTVIRANLSPNIFIHIMSTMRMGLVTDTNCEAKQVQRLYIADNSVLFNGLGGPNPTLTTQALAARTSDKIAEKYFS